MLVLICHEVRDAVFKHSGLGWLPVTYVTQPRPRRLPSRNNLVHLILSQSNCYNELSAFSPTILSKINIFV